MSVSESFTFWELSVIATVLFFILLAAGCTSLSSTPFTPSGSSNVPTTPTLTVTTSHTIEHAIRNNSTENVTNATVLIQNPEIEIDPIPDHHIGDTITIEGTTNLAPGEVITLWIGEGVYHSCPKSSGACNDSVRHCCGGVINKITVIPGNCGINRWSWIVNTSQHGFRPDFSYIFVATGRNGLVQNTSVFNVLPIPPYIRLNIPEDGPNGTTIRLSGIVNTGNGPGEKLFLSISSDSGAAVNSTIPIVFDGKDYHWNFTLTKSLIYPYNYYTVNITSLSSPEIGNIGTFSYPR
jgi:hypothetical protein